MDIEQIKKDTAAVLNCDPATLSYITPELIAAVSANGSAIKPDDSPNILSGNYSGNHFVINGRVWSWMDQIGSYCGQARTWTYNVQPGATARQAGNCPQGYPWFEMYCVF